MSIEKTQNVQPATAEKPIEEQQQPFQLVPEVHISGKAKAAAKSFGIDLGPVEELAPKLNAWGDSVEKRLDMIIKALPGIPAATVQILRNEAQKQREQQVQQVQQVQQAAQQAGAAPDLNSLAGLLGPIMEALKGSSSSGDELLKTLAMDSLKAELDLSRTIKSAIVSKIAAKASTDIAGAVTAT